MLAVVNTVSSVTELKNKKLEKMEVIHQGNPPKELEPLLFHCKCGTQVKCNRNEVVTFREDAQYKGPDYYKHVLRCPTCHRYVYLKEVVNDQTSSAVTLVM